MTGRGYSHSLTGRLLYARLWAAARERNHTLPCPHGNPDQRMSQKGSLGQASEVGADLETAQDKGKGIQAENGWGRNWSQLENRDGVGGGSVCVEEVIQT